jgi:hypothetical protein
VCRARSASIVLGREERGGRLGQRRQLVHGLGGAGGRDDVADERLQPAETQRRAVAREALDGGEEHRRRADVGDPAVPVAEHLNGALDLGRKLGRDRRVAVDRT